MIKNIIMQQLPYNLIIFSNIICYFYKRIDEKKYNKIILISLLILFFLNTFCLMTPDVSSYKYILKIFSDIGTYHTEKIYYFLAKYVAFNIFYFRASIALSQYALLYYYLKNKNLHFKKIFFLMFLLGLSFESLNVIRVFLAIILFLNAVDKYEENKILFLIFSGMSIIFHKTFIITNLFFLFCCLIKKVLINHQRIFSFVVYIFLISIPFLFLLRNSNLVEYFLIKLKINPYYFTKNIKYEGMFIWQLCTFFITVINNIIYIYFEVIFLKNKIYKIQDIFSFFSIILYFILYILFENTFLSSRFILNSLIIIFTSYSEIFVSENNKYISIPLYLYVIIFFIFDNILIIRYISWNS